MSTGSPGSALRPPRPAASGTATTGALLNRHGKPNAVAQPLEVSDDTHLDHRRNAGGYARRADPRPELLRVEWCESNDTRAARWLLTAIALHTTGAAMVPLCLPHEMQQRWPSYLAVTGVVLVLMCRWCRS
jgi:hypothetical protein